MSVVANVAINVDSRAAVSKLRDVQSQAGATQRAFDGLGAAVGKLAAAFAGIQAVKFVFAKTAELESQTRSLQVLTGSAQKAKQIIQELQQLGAVTPFTSTELIDAAKRLQAFGVEANNVVETTKRLADVSGATGAELQGLVTAYGQVQAKGRLQGEELLQFQERGVALQAELRKMYGLSGDEFQKALEKGRISAKAVEVAIQRLTSAGGKYANGAIAQSDTLNGKLSTLQDGVDALARRIGQVLTPVLKAIFNQAITVVDAINAALAAGRGGGLTRNVAGARQFLNIGATSEAVDRITKGVGQVDLQKSKTGIQQNLQALQQYQRLLQSIGPDDPNANKAVQLQGVILQKINQNIAAQKELKTSTQQTNKIFTTPALLAPSSGGKGGGGKSAGKSDAEKLAEELKRSLEEGKQLSVEFARQVMLLNAASETETKRLQIQFEYQDRQKQILDLKNPEQQKTLQLLNDDIKRLENRKLDLEIIKEGLEAFEKIAGLDFSKTEGLGARAFGQGSGGGFRADISLLTGAKETQKYEEMSNQLKELTDPINVAVTGAQTIGNAFGQAFQEIINGSSSAQEALAKMMQSIGQNFVNMAAQIIAQQTTMIILGTIMKALGIGGGSIFGSGGAPNFSGAFSGSPATGLSGFTPGLNLMPGRANGGPVSAGSPYVVGEHGPELFVPGRNGSVVSNSNLRNAMGSAPGSSGSPVLHMSFQTTTIGGVEYVSRDQLEAAMAETRRAATRDGAKQGMSMTLDRIKQSPQTRSRIGIR